MQIVYPYNEILPKKTAHDIYVFQECAAFATHGIETTLLCGKGSKSDSWLGEYYLPSKEIPKNFKIERLPILRKNTFANISWNLPFFLYSQKTLKKLWPSFIVASVLKQALFHFQKKMPGVRYIYEVHQLEYYPERQVNLKQLAMEKKTLSLADAIVVTTQQLKNILLQAPYEINIPIEVIPLAVASELSHLPLNQENQILGYVGQLYPGQGLEILLKALKEVPEAKLKIIGGKKEDIERLKALSHQLGVSSQAHFVGFVSPCFLKDYLSDIRAFIAPFEAIGRMPYVAHTKLFEYCEWNKPVIVPNLPVAREHFTQGGALFFDAGNLYSLADAIKKIYRSDSFNQLQQEMGFYRGKYLWEQRIKHYVSFLSNFI
jgi:glycosyltransferase involved in cell wall biosynthesis